MHCYQQLQLYLIQLSLMLTTRFPTITKVTEINKAIRKQEDDKTSEHHIISGEASLGVPKQFTKSTKKETIAGFGADILRQTQQLVTKVKPQKEDIYIYAST